MKRNVQMLLAAGVLASLTFNSCKKKDDAGSGGAYTAKVSFVIDGDDFSKQTVSYTGSAKAANYCYYSSKYKVTNLGIGDAPNISTDDKNKILMVFNGSKEGKQNAGDDTNGGSISSVYFQVTVTDKSGTKHVFLFENGDTTPGTITITKFGAAGATVEGTFSGTLVDEDGSPNITIAKGTFSITRNNDLD